MSNVTTNNINPQYPEAGKNNNVQGFRDNFAAIKSALEQAKNELSELQSKSLFKTPLTGTTLANDMAGGLIRNATITGFRLATYNLGNALQGIITIDTSGADVLYGGVKSNTTFQFTKWTPAGTERSITLHLTFTDPTAVVTFPSNVIVDGNSLLENSVRVADVLNIHAPADSSMVSLKLTTIDCGATITVTPLNRPFRATQLVEKTPPPTGTIGDTVGTAYLGVQGKQVTVTNTYANNRILTTSTADMYPGMAVEFAGPVFGNISPATTYYVNAVHSSTLFDVSLTYDDTSNNVVSLSAANGTMTVTPVSYLYVATEEYSATKFDGDVASTTAPNIVTVAGSTANLRVNAPIVFTGTGNTGNLLTNTTYFIKSIAGNNLTLSRVRYSGVAGPEVNTIATVGSGSINIDYTTYVGPSIFKRTRLEDY